MSFDLLPHQPKRSRYQIHRFKTYLNCIHHDLSFNVSLLCEVKIIFLPYLCTCDYKKVRHPPLEIIFSIWLTCEDLLLPYSSQRPRLLAIAPRDFSCHRCRVSNWSPVVQPRLHPSVFVSKLHLQREQRSSFHRRDLLLTATAISATKVVDLSSNCRGSQAAFILHQATSLEILVYGIHGTMVRSSAALSSKLSCGTACNNQIRFNQRLQLRQEQKSFPWVLKWGEMIR